MADVMNTSSKAMRSLSVRDVAEVLMSFFSASSTMRVRVMPGRQPVSSGG